MKSNVLKKISLFIVAGLLSVSVSAADAGEQKRAVGLVEIGYSVVSAQNTYSGFVQSSQRVDLAFRVSAPLDKVYIQKGEMVKKGALLMQLDDRDFQDQMSLLKTQVKQAKINLNYEKIEFNRAKKLYDKNVISQAQYDGKKVGYDLAGSQIKTLEAQIRIVRHQIEDTKLLAPYDCVIDKLLVENFQMINRTQPVVTISDISSYEIEILVPENKITKYKLEKDAPAFIEFPALKNKPVAAGLKEWNIEADPVTRSYQIVFECKPEADLRILPGMTAIVNWHENSAGKDKMLIVPARCVTINRDKKKFVWVYDKKTEQAEKRYVQIAADATSQGYIIQSGLSAGEILVKEGSDFINSEMILEAVNTSKVGG